MQSETETTAGVYAFHPRSDGHGFDLLLGVQNLGTLRVEDRELVVEYAEIVGRLLRSSVRVIGGE